MKTDSLFLEGKHVRLEPLELSHTQGLGAAAAADLPVSMESCSAGRDRGSKVRRDRVDMERRGHRHTVRNRDGGR